MTISEAAEKLHLHPTALSKKVKAGEIAGEKVKGKWEIADAEVARWLEMRYEYHPDWIDVAEVAKIVRKADKTVRKYIQDGVLDARYDPLCQTRKLFIKRDRLEPMRRILSTYK